MSVQSTFETIQNRINSDERDQLLAVGSVFQFHFTGDEAGDWYIDLKNGSASQGTASDADCTVTMDGGDFVDLYNGDEQGMTLFMSGRLQLDGDMGVAMKLMEIMG